MGQSTIVLTPLVLQTTEEPREITDSLKDSLCGCTEIWTFYSLHMSACGLDTGSSRL